MTRPPFVLRGELEVGTLVGGEFEVVSRLANGGMGELYVARQRSTGFLRALKRMHAHLLVDAVARARFAREARLIAKIQSAHVAQVIAAGFDEESRSPFIAMELLRGTTVAAALKAGPFSRERAVEIMLGVSHALAAAHRVGIVHRDIKPDNVMLADSQLADRSTVVKVIDFGIALVTAGTLAQRYTVEETLGTPPYMAPEQLVDSSQVGPHTDVWAMGLMMFVMLTGQPFWRTKLRGEATIALLLQEIVEQPITPSAMRASELGIQLDPYLAYWIDLCLQRDVRSRFRDGSAAHHALLAIAAVEQQPRLTAEPHEFAPTVAMPAVQQPPRAAPDAPTRFSVPTNARSNASNPRDGRVRALAVVGTALGAALVIRAWSRHAPRDAIATGPSAGASFGDQASARSEQIARAPTPQASVARPSDVAREPGLGAVSADAGFAAPREAPHTNDLERSRARTSAGLSAIERRDQQVAQRLRQTLIQARCMQPGAAVGEWHLSFAANGRLVDWNTRGVSAFVYICARDNEFWTMRGPTWPSAYELTVRIPYASP